jgi:hypothetical protein
MQTWCVLSKKKVAALKRLSHDILVNDFANKGSIAKKSVDIIDTYYGR